MAGHRRVLHCGVAMGGAFSNGASGTATPTAATVSGKPMLVDYVAVYSKNRGRPFTSSQLVRNLQHS
jgi:hypothetical protein